MEQPIIKYRAYCKKRRRMYPVISLHISDSSNPWATVKGYSVIEQKDIHLTLQPEKCILMQWAGTFDGNGKEIYHRDIIGDGNTVFEVVYSKGKFDLKRVSGSYQYPYFGDNCSRMFVLGNTIQNKNLLP